jgi:hypothetical protein
LFLRGLPHCSHDAGLRAIAEVDTVDEVAVLTTAAVPEALAFDFASLAARNAVFAASFAALL